MNETVMPNRKSAVHYKDSMDGQVAVMLVFVQTSKKMGKLVGH
jgi:hypothetical protein